jgi:hypothetical protein
LTVNICLCGEMRGVSGGDGEGHECRLPHCTVGTVLFELYFLRCAAMLAPVSVDVQASWISCVLQVMTGESTI